MASYGDSLRQSLDDDGGGGGEDEEEELFEINLDAVGGVLEPHQWEGYFTATGNVALLANCLLPTSDVSSAIPTATDACKSFSMAEQLMMFQFRSPYSYLEEIQGCTKRISKGI